MPITGFQIQGVAPKSADQRFLLARHGLGLIPVPRRLRKVEDSLTNCGSKLSKESNPDLLLLACLL